MSVRGPRAIVFVALTLAGCDGPRSLTQPVVQLDRRITALMECYECTEGQERAVIAMGDTARSVLSSVLEHGPPVARVTAVRRSVDSLVANDPTLSPGVVNRYVSRFVAIYRMRAAHALGLLGGAGARAALCHARSLGFQPSVIAEIDSGAVATGGLCT